MANERAQEWRARLETAFINYGSALAAHQTHPSERSWGRLEAHKTVLRTILDEPLSWGVVNVLPATRSELPPLEWDDEP